MADQIQKFCGMCQRNVLATRPPTNHILHFLITVISCGLWVVVWLGLSIRAGGHKCSSCGNPNLLEARYLPPEEENGDDDEEDD